MLETSSQRRLLSVQALRGFAAILVLFLHCAALQRDGLAPERTAEAALLKGFWDQGYAGVDLFFVISGFIMVYVTQNHVPSLREAGRFLYSRASRIYPLYWACTSVMILYFMASYGIPASPTLANGDYNLALYTAKSLLLLPQSAMPVLGVGWTLIHEMYFYLVFAGILLLPRRYMLYCLGAWAALILGVRIVVTPDSYAKSIFAVVSSPLTLEFIAGALMGYLITRKIWLAPKIITVIAAGLVLAALVYDHYFNVNRVWLYTIPFALLVYGVSAMEHLDRIHVPQWMVTLGDWSYSLYLTHMLVFLAIRRILRMLSPHLPEAIRLQAVGAWDNIFFAVITLVSAIVFSALSYRFVEQPLLRVTKRFSKRKRLPEAKV